MRDMANERKRELECLRLAADFAQLGRDTLNPVLRAHCVRMAEMWSGQFCWDPQDSSVQSVLYH